ncbi:hypothetical protein GGI25_005668 [Coemansia spiralis]|uniref:GLTSCR protein conserved domain-containing protein n=2 Tax=Coemansia TaxID=4863 RepID=A0A9W8G3P6_9FUNG|nr:hypothetical protein GGI25_005668 [Coemansia spiralis]
MSPGPSTTNVHKTDGRPLTKQTTPSTDTSSIGSSSRGTSQEPLENNTASAAAPIAHTHHQNTMQQRARPTTTPRPNNTTPRFRPPVSAQGPLGQTQLLRKIAVAGVTIEVVRQGSQIIYRLPGNMPVSALTPDQRTKVMEEIQRIRNSSTAPTNSARAPMIQQPSPRPPVLSKSSNNVSVATTPKPMSPAPQMPLLVRYPQQPPTRPAVRSSATKQNKHTTQQSADQQQRGSPAYSRPRPLLPNIAPRLVLSHPAGSDSMNTIPQSAPLPGSLASPATPFPGSLPQKQQQQTSLRSLTPNSVQKPPQQSMLASSAVTQRSALERMYQSAYLKLLSGPTEVLKRLNPPVDLSSIVKDDGLSATTDKAAISPAMLLQVLKALTKAQATQLANMYDRELKAGRGSLEIGTSGLRMPGIASQPQSGRSSPVPGTISDAGLDGDLDRTDSDSATPTKKRKVGKATKPPAKKRSISTSDPVSTSSLKVEKLPPRPMSYVHTDLIRIAQPSLADRRKRPSQTKHEAEVSRRFREALAMDHQMVQDPDWQTPFSGTRDIIQRLLPFHVFQYPDTAIDFVAEHMEDKICRSVSSLEKRYEDITARYNSILAKEASDSFYNVDNIQLDMQRLNYAKEQTEQLRDAQLQHDISLVGSVANTGNNSNRMSSNC